jgi:hypothetical protein
VLFESHVLSFCLLRHQPVDENASWTLSILSFVAKDDDWIDGDGAVLLEYYLSPAMKISDAASNEKSTSSSFSLICS